MRLAAKVAVALSNGSFGFAERNETALCDRESPSSEDIGRLHDARDAFVGFFNRMTRGRGHIETRIEN